ncbi:MAG: translation initiation factor IF-2, partial [Proteobacteria bacterium]|nr:translation initiation factor IF-2 [Pseudomonadota bacterium]
MSKIRIYELAKELGVENKVVLSTVARLGITGKSSHSSSLEADEADQIRRSIIRSAIGVSPDSEVVTKRVDKQSGATGTFLERRKGNVIRRRRQGEGEESVDAGPQPTEVVTEAAPEVAEGSLALKQESTITTEFEAVEPAPVEAEVEVAEQLPVEIVEEVIAAVPAETAVPHRPAEPAPVVPVSAPAEKPQAKEPQPAPVVVKKGIGPRVLGKIELAPKRPEKAPAKKSQTVAEGWTIRPTVVDESEEEEGGDKRKDAKKRSRKREVTRLDMLDYDGREGRRSPRGGKGGKKEEQRLQPEATAMKASKRVVEMAETISVGELAKQLSVKAGQVIAKLIELGVMATINQALDKDTAEIVAGEFGFTVASTSFDEATILESNIVDAPETLKSRPPIVTVMGHVDHGKTSLLDSIRKASVVSGEAGGITQHIGAYSVQLEGGKSVTFIDTPGHAAFTSMRARGAQVTDIVILVVAADEGPKPQTIEALNHAKAAGVAIVVALNKVDKPDANPDRVKQQLGELGLHPEEWGGDTMYFPVSATKKTGIKELLEGLLLIAELKELKANPDRKARGTVIETRQDKGRGVVTTILVQTGTLRIGDIFVTGAESGRVRSMHSDTGERLEVAGPSTPVEVTGLDGVPSAGDDFFVVDSEAQAREVALERRHVLLAKERALASGPISLEEFARRANNMGSSELNVILKADVHGSVEAVSQSIEKMSTPKVKVRVLHSAVGAINESDVALAKASKAIIVGFNVRAEPRASSEAEVAGIELRFYRIIYELLDDVKQAMAGLLAPIKREKSLGRVEVRETFIVPKVGTIAGCYVTDGMVKRSAMARLVRDGKVVHEGKMSSLRRFKDDVR